MSQFQATLAGNASPVSRQGTKASGLTVDVNGWNSGVRVVASHVDGVDVFKVYATGGSNDGWGSSAQLIATVPA